MNFCSQVICVEGRHRSCLRKGFHRIHYAAFPPIGGNRYPEVYTWEGTHPSSVQTSSPSHQRPSALLDSSTTSLSS